MPGGAFYKGRPNGRFRRPERPVSTGREPPACFPGLPGLTLREEFLKASRLIGEWIVSSLGGPRRALCWARCLFAAALVALPAHAAAPPDGSGPVLTPPETNLERALAAPIDLDFDAVPIEDAVKTIAAKSGLTIVLDGKNILEYMSNRQATLHARGLRVSSALDLMLMEHSMSFYIRDEIVVISTKEASEESLLVRVYPVGDLVNVPGVLAASPDRPFARKPNFDSLIEAITGCVDPDSWDESGGAGAIESKQGGSAASDALVVLQSWQTHKKVERLLADLRAVRLAPQPHTVAAAPLAPAARTARAACGEPVEVKVYRLASPSRRAKQGGSATPREPDEVARLVQDTVEPGRWQRGQMRVLKGALVIRQTPDIQAKVLGLLWELGVLQDP